MDAGARGKRRSWPGGCPGAAGAGADALICLGDLLLFIDYADHSQGIFPDLFGAEQARRLVELRSAGRFDEATGDVARAVGAAWRRPAPAHRGRGVATVRRAVRGDAGAVVPDVRERGPAAASGPSTRRPGQHILDGERVELDGWTFGFVGGGLRTTYRTPNELDDEVFAAKVEAIGEVDVLCAHIPPAVPDLLYDTVARRMERGSEALLATIEKTQPRYVLFGHVHQPLQSRVRIGGDRVH